MSISTVNIDMVLYNILMECTRRSHKYSRQTNGECCMCQIDKREKMIKQYRKELTQMRSEMRIQKYMLWWQYKVWLDRQILRAAKEKLNK